MCEICIIIIIIIIITIIIITILIYLKLGLVWPVQQKIKLSLPKLLNKCS